MKNIRLYAFGLHRCIGNKSHNKFSYPVFQIANPNK